MLLNRARFARSRCGRSSYEGGPESKKYFFFLFSVLYVILLAYICLSVVCAVHISAGVERGYWFLSFFFQGGFHGTGAEMGF